MLKNSTEKNLNEIHATNVINDTSITRLWNAAIYARLSRDDGDKIESDSIVNQKDLIKDFLKSKPDIKICSERVDDGFSGVSFDRPALNAMLDDVKSGKIDCIVVKDLSRFGRNYIEVGRYIRTLFPLLGVRFIAINDGYDSAEEKSLAHDYIIPFKNIINDAYCADISKKIRSQFEIKRKKGDYIGALVPFGYLKSSENKNRLIVDEIAAEVVKDIFKWKLAGMSQQGIADKLNSLGVPSPLEYKKSMGIGCSAAFKVNPKAKWSANSIKRILRDEVYTGTLIQGKTTTPNYKIKNKIVKDKSEWVCVENAHKAIIKRKDFELVADLLGRDTYKTEVYPFSGMLFCSKCKQTLIRKVSTVDGAKYIFHACIKKHANDKRAGCSGIRIKESELFDIVTVALRNYIKSVIDIEQLLQFVENMPTKEKIAQRLQNQIEVKKGEIDKLENRKVRLYEDYSDNKITVEEYGIFKNNYDSQIAETENSLFSLQKELADYLPDTKQDNINWIEYFEDYSDFTKLSREIIVKFIDKIIIYESGNIEIIFRYKNEYKEIINLIGTLSDVEVCK